MFPPGPPSIAITNEVETTHDETLFTQYDDDDIHTDKGVTHVVGLICHPSSRLHTRASARAHHLVTSAYGSNEAP
jgi:hypothetical protein